MKTVPKSYLVGVGVVSLAIVGAGWWAAAENQGQVSRSATDATVKPVGAQQYIGETMVFNFEGMYQLRRLDPTDNDLELATLLANTNYEKSVAVSVSTLKDSNLSNNSAYMLRQSQPAVYRQKTVMTAGGQAEVWTKSDGSEQTVFIPRAGRVAVLSFTTAGMTNGLDEEVSELLQSFRWKD